MCVSRTLAAYSWFHGAGIARQNGGRAMSALCLSSLLGLLYFPREPPCHRPYFSYVKSGQVAAAICHSIFYVRNSFRQAECRGVKQKMCYTGVRALERAPARNKMLLQTAYNNLGVALLDHGKNVQALEFLLKAEALFLNQQPGQPAITADAVKAADLLQHLSLKGSENENVGQSDAVMDEGDAGGTHNLCLPTSRCAHVTQALTLHPVWLARRRQGVDRAASTHNLATSLWDGTVVSQTHTCWLQVAIVKVWVHTL